MKTPHNIIGSLILSMLCAGGLTLQAQQPNATDAPVEESSGDDSIDGEQEPKEEKEEGIDLKSFDVVIKMNIFDPERGTPPPKPRPATPPPPPVPDRMSLKGTLVEPGKSHAFLDGNQSDFRKVAELNASVGDFKLKEITSEYAILSLEEGNEFKLMVGDELERPPEGEWKLISNSGRSGFSSGSGMGSASAPSSSSNDESEMSDVMKRLMERRKQQMGN